MEIGPFTEAASRNFLSKSGLDLGTKLEKDIIYEASEIEETKGLKTNNNIPNIKKHLSTFPLF